MFLRIQSYELVLYILRKLILLLHVVPWFRLLIGGLLTWRAGFDPRLFHVRVLSDRIAV